MGKREVIEKLRLYKSIVSEHFDIDQVILFGSYAKGTQKDDSDIDVAIIVNSLDSDFFTYAPLLWKLRQKVDNRIEPVLFLNGKDPVVSFRKYVSRVLKYRSFISLLRRLAACFTRRSAVKLSSMRLAASQLQFRTFKPMTSSRIGFLQIQVPASS